jgi:hypothetical protein
MQLSDETINGLTLCFSAAPYSQVGFVRTAICRSHATLFTACVRIHRLIQPEVLNAVVETTLTLLLSSDDSGMSAFDGIFERDKQGTHQREQLWQRNWTLLV